MGAPLTSVTSVPKSADVIIAVAPDEVQLQALKDFSESSGLDKLVIILNARFEDKYSITDETRQYFQEGGRGDFMYTFAWNTQPLGLREGSEEGVVLWRSYPGNWVLALKPKIGSPEWLLESKSDEGRPSREALSE